MREKLDECERLGGDVNQRLRRYLAEINSLNQDVGRLLRRIDELGLREKTLVVFSSDHGPAPCRWKLITAGRKHTEIQLFDLSTDRGEQRNVFSKSPEIAQDLRAKINAWNATLPKEYVHARSNED